MKQFLLILSFLFYTLASFCQDAVDLGLSVKWAACNVGANTPEGYGDFFDWDEAQELSNSNWRVPTQKEIRELLENCDYKWTTQNGVEGGLFTSKINGNSIFLPAAGYLDDSDVYGVGSNGYYWSSSAYYYYDYGYAGCLGFDGDGAYVSGGDLDYGLSVRLVLGL